MIYPKSSRSTTSIPPTSSANRPSSQASSGNAAIGWVVEEYDRAQISINLTDCLPPLPHVVLERVRELAAERGLVVMQNVGPSPSTPFTVRALLPGTIGPFYGRPLRRRAGKRPSSRWDQRRRNSRLPIRFWVIRTSGA
ncbi:MAG: hypothetical protein MZV63_63720 [Marinilabiliales bacterium]|nr:hypothetical protein [Marinilabiliales bacterium]